MKLDRKGVLFVICGPSGVGKGTVLSAALKSLEGISFSVSATTRCPRPGEVEGKHYFFLSREDFEKRISKEEFLEWNFHFDNYYGTPKSFIENNVNSGKDVILDIDVKGALILIEKKVDAAYVFIVPPSMEELNRRLKERGTESDEKIASRLERAKQEMSTINCFDYLILNDKIDEAVDNFISIVSAERCRVFRLNPETIKI